MQHVAHFPTPRRANYIRRTVASLLLLVALSACSAGAPVLPSDGLPNPGISFFDATARKAALRSTSCDPYQPPSLASFQPSVINGTGGWSGFSRQPRAFAEAVNGVAMQYLDTSNPIYANDAIKNLRRFADADAFQLRGKNNASAYAAGQVIQFLLPAWQVLLTYPGLTEGDKAAIEPWLIRMVERNQRERPDRNNHNTSKAMTRVLAGAIFNRRGWFESGVRDGYFDQIDQLRPDGSFPFETARGQWGVVYQSRNIAHLVTIAETARNQGIDLYDYAPNGVSLHDAIRSLIAANDNHSLIDGYAQANQFVPDDYATFQFDAQRDPFAGHDTSWVPVYARRFAGTPLAAVLRSRKPPTANQGIRYPPVSGNVTCMVGL